MRIIAGTARRTVLEVAPGSSTRPFLEMARGALFNALADRVPDASVLDLFAGSGALGLEALSRGAASCLFVERDPTALKALTKNIAKCGMADRARVVRMEVTAALPGIPGRFDLVFVDPPFPDLAEWRAGGLMDGAMREACRLTSPEGVLVFRLEDGKASPPDWPGLRLTADRKYGRSRICRYEK